VTGAPLSAAGALAWLRSLSTDLGAAAVLDADGALLAGDPDAGRRAAAALAAQPDAREVHDGGLLVVRGAGHTVAAALGPRALVRVARLDLATAAEALGDP
jgi:hypothetical protein